MNERDKKKLKSFVEYHEKLKDWDYAAYENLEIEFLIELIKNLEKMNEELKAQKLKT